jgi:hypothetical protein
MAKRQRRTREEFWIGLIVVALLAYAFTANWWKQHSALGWTIVAILIALLGFSIYRFPAFRRWLFMGAKKAGRSIMYETETSEREPLPPDLREHILKRAHYKCENPDCREHIKPHIHHIDCDNSNNRPGNLIALCPNCHTKAHHGVGSPSQLRNWVQRSWAIYKRETHRFR